MEVAVPRSLAGILCPRRKILIPVPGVHVPRAPRRHFHPPRERERSRQGIVGAGGI